MNIIWEDKGILLGIMKYILKHNKNLIDKNIIIENKKFRTILKSLFNHYSFKKKIKKNGFEINIRNNKDNGLIINNINNLDTIHSKKYRCYHGMIKIIL